MTREQNKKFKEIKNEYVPILDNLLYDLQSLERIVEVELERPLGTIIIKLK